MMKNLSRRSLIQVAAGVTALGAPSRTFGAANLIQDSGSNTEITLWTAFGSGVNGEAQQKLVDEYNAQSNGVTVTAQTYDGYEALANSVITGLQTGDIPDIATLSDVWWFRFYLTQSLLDLTDLVDTPDDYVDSFYSDYQRNNGQWGVPFARSTPLLYFNRDVLEKAGLDESIFGTWSDFRDNAQSLLDAAPDMLGALGFAQAADHSAWVLQGPTWAFDGQYSDEEFTILVTDEGCVNTGEFFRDFAKDGLAVAVNDVSTDFQTGSVGAVLQTTGALGNITKAANFDFGTMFLPEELQFGCCTGGTGLSVMSDIPEEKQQAAVDFATFCTNTDNAAYWAKTTGYMPVRTSAIESDDFQAFLADNPNNKVAIDQLPKTRSQDSARVFIPNGDQILSRGWDQIIINQVPAQDAWDEVKSILDEEKQPVLEAIKEIEG